MLGTPFDSLKHRPYQRELWVSGYNNADIGSFLVQFGQSSPGQWSCIGLYSQAGGGSTRNARETLKEITSRLISTASLMSCKRRYFLRASTSDNRPVCCWALRKRLTLSGESFSGELSFSGGLRSAETLQASNLL